MRSVAIGSQSRIGRRLAAAAVLAALLACVGPSAGVACWDEYSDAEKAFREGFEFFLDKEWERAIDRLKDAKEDRREADANCTVQLSARRSDHKAYYLPRFYLGVASFKMFDALGDENRACEEAMMFFGDSLRVKQGERRTIYEKYRSRLRDEWAQLNEIREICGSRASGEASLARFGRRSPTGQGGTR